MPVVQSIINIDDLYSTTERKIILNRITLSQDNIRELIYTTYSNEISLIPQCECGYYKAGYLKGKICPKCGTSVISTFDNIEPILWIEKFRDDLKFINPDFWMMLSRIINSKIDGLRWLADTSYNPPTIPNILNNLKHLIGGRSYINVYNNIEKIIIYLKNNSSYKVFNKQIALENIHHIYKNSKDKLYSNYLPFINKKLFVMEQTNKGDYTQIILGDIIDLAILAINTANDVTMTDKRLMNNMAKLISGAGNLYTNYVHELVAGKKKLMRRNIYGTRAHFTFRCVVSALKGIYDYDEIHVPWMILTTTFRPHVYNKLIKRGYTPKQASSKIFKATLNYDTEIADIGKELINESRRAGYKGIPVLANRNPSLKQGSIQLVFITKFKEEIDETSVSISSLIATAFNMDFDGDDLIDQALSIKRPPTQ